MKLVLVESPTKARKLTSYLGDGYVVRASVGHVRDLPKSRMGVDIAHDFEPEYLVPKEKAKVVKELQGLAKKADEIVIATDPDREGEAIGWHLEHVLSENEKGKVSTKVPHFIRASFHEITKGAVLSALEHPSTLNLDLVNAQQARRVLDRLVGYSVSPVLWKKIRSGLSAGRVQSVALRFIVEREREIAAFKPEEYWEVDILLATKNAKIGESKKTDQYFQNNKIENIPTEMIVARVIEVDGKSFDPKVEADVLPVVKNLPAAAYAVQSVEKKERQRVSLPPFTTSTLQQQAANRFGYTSKSTMRLAQDLYEEGLITYHRTDAVTLSSQAIDMARGYIHEQYGPTYLPEQARLFATKTKNAQEAHEAIRVTDVRMQGEAILGCSSRFREQHVKLYDLIWRRYIASQMQSAIYDQTTILITAQADQHQTLLKTSGSILKFDGWMKLFPNQGDIILPEVQSGDPLTFVESNAAQRFTEPPPRYNDASLIKTLEKEGIGRPSTYASIISVIEERSYVERQDKKFIPTAIGIAVNDFLVQHFPTIVDYQFTATMEDDLDAISRGEKEWHHIVGDFYKPLEKTVEDVVKNVERAQIPVEKTGEPCPKCGATEHGEVVIRIGRYGKFRSCSRYPECDFSENIVNKLEGVKCPLCQEGDVVIKPTRWRRDFYSCSRYPECDWASWSKPQAGLVLTKEQWAEMQAKRAERRAAFAERKKAMEERASSEVGATTGKTKVAKTKKPKKSSQKKA